MTVRRGFLWVLLGLAVLCATLPMRTALWLAGADKAGVAARGVEGPVWWAYLFDARMGPFALGHVDASVSLPHLLGGRVRLAVWRGGSPETALSATLSTGWGHRALENVTATLPAGNAFGPVPVSSIALTRFGVTFSGGRCAQAGGDVRVRFGGRLANLALAQGMSGTAQCDGAALLLPLTSQSGMETMRLRIDADGRTHVRLSVRRGQGADDAALAALGFALIGPEAVLTMDATAR